MQRFHFSLERVLEWQVKVCHAEEEKLRLWLLAVSETEEKLVRLKADSMATEHESLKHESIPAEDLNALGRYRVRVTRNQRELKLKREEQLHATGEQMQKLSDERQRLHLIEKLRERALHEHTIAVDRELEALALDSHLAKWISGAHRGSLSD